MTLIEFAAEDVAAGWPSAAAAAAEVNAHLVVNVI